MKTTFTLLAFAFVASAAQAQQGLVLLNETLTHGYHASGATDEDNVIDYAMTSDNKTSVLASCSIGGTLNISVQTWSGKRDDVTGQREKFSDRRLGWFELPPRERNWKRCTDIANLIRGIDATGDKVKVAVLDRPLRLKIQSSERRTGQIKKEVELGGWDPAADFKAFVNTTIFQPIRWLSSGVAWVGRSIENSLDRKFSDDRDDIDATIPDARPARKAE